VTDLLLRQAQASRAGAQGDDDYDVIGTDGMVIGRIFKATTSPAGTPWMWTLAYGDHEDRTPTHGLRCTARGRDGGVRQSDCNLAVETRLRGGADIVNRNPSGVAVGWGRSGL
jgi:hypothetical protein